jgi:hypothetical protein
LWADQTLTKRDSWSEILRNNTILKTSYDKELDFHIIFYQWFCCKIFWLWTLNILYWVFLSKIKLINRKIGKAFWKKKIIYLWIALLQLSQYSISKWLSKKSIWFSWHRVLENFMKYEFNLKIELYLLIKHVSRGNLYFIISSTKCIHKMYE